MMSDLVETKITLHYGSRDPENPLYHHQMDLSQLTPILNAMNKMLRDVNRIYNDEQEIKVRLGEGAMKKGCLEIVFQVFQSPEAIDVLRAMGITVVSGSVVFEGAMAAIKKLKGKKIKTVRSVDGSNDVELESVDGVKVNCTQSEKRLVTHPSFRRHVDQVFSAPFTTANADEISLGILEQSDSQPEEERLVTFSLDDSDAFASPDEVFDTEEKITVINANVKFKDASTKTAEGWAVEIGQKEHKVEILDKIFLTKLQDSTTGFNFGKAYKADLVKTETTKAGTGRSKTKYQIKKVYI